MNSSVVNVASCRWVIALLLSALLVACMTPGAEQSTQDETNYGVLLMAHGGGANWNESVLEAVEQLRQRYPVEVAFGMADAGSLEQAVRKLESAGVEHVGVVRLFISGESWFDRTRQILGMLDGAPSREAWEADSATRGHGAMPMGFWAIESRLNFHLSEEGLADAQEMDAVLLDRLRALSHNPAHEVALVLAHGPADDDEDARWVAKISERTRLAEQRLGLADVRVFTLREDWEEKREGAEEAIRRYIARAGEEGLDVMVIPYRVQGFGPYADVLAGLDYIADGVGLLPHRNVGLWVQNQAARLQQEASRHHGESLAAAP